MSESKRRTEALEKAKDAFWASIASSYPEINRGDLDPMSTMNFDGAVETVFDEWYHNNHRIFSGVYPTGIVWADRYIEKHGDYKKLAYLNFGTLELEVQKDCPDLTRGRGFNTRDCTAIRSCTRLRLDQYRHRRRGTGN